MSVVGQLETKTVAALRGRQRALVTSRRRRRARRGTGRGSREAVPPDEPSRIFDPASASRGRTGDTHILDQTSIAHVPRQTTRSPAMTYRRLEAKEGDRFYREAGAGESIVLLHCSSGSSGAWAPVMNLLGQDYRVLAPDLLGYGRSARWPRTPLGPNAELGVVEVCWMLLDDQRIWSATPTVAPLRCTPRCASPGGLLVSPSLSLSPFTCCGVRMSLTAGARSQRWPSATWRSLAKGEIRQPPRPLLRTGPGRRPGRK